VQFLANRAATPIQGDFVERKIGELDFFREHGVSVTVLTAKRGRVVGSYFLAIVTVTSHVAWLNSSDGVQRCIIPPTVRQLLGSGLADGAQRLPPGDAIDDDCTVPKPGFRRYPMESI
jgi:hypothetical protein